MVSIKTHVLVVSRVFSVFVSEQMGFGQGSERCCETAVGQHMCGVCRGQQLHQRASFVSEGCLQKEREGLNEAGGTTDPLR